MYPCKSKGIFLLAIFQKEDQLEIIWIHVIGTTHFSVKAIAFVVYALLRASFFAMPACICCACTFIGIISCHARLNLFCMHFYGQHFLLCPLAFVVYAFLRASFLAMSFCICCVFTFTGIISCHARLHIPRSSLAPNILRAWHYRRAITPLCKPARREYENFYLESYWNIVCVVIMQGNWGAVHIHGLVMLMHGAKE